MKKTLRIAALLIAAIMLTAGLCGCSTFVDAFIEGYNSALEENSPNTNDDDDDVFVFSGNDDNNAGDPTGEYDFGNSKLDNLAESIFASRPDSADNSDVLGKWIDVEDDVINFYDDGTATYFDAPVDEFTFNGEFLTFSAEDEEYKYPARLYGDTFVIFYEPFYYSRVDGETGSFTGRWESSDDNDYSFEFYDDGTFTEDDEYAGYYYINGSDILLVYENSFVEYCIFTMHEDGDQLGFAYGWTLERIG